MKGAGRGSPGHTKVCGTAKAFGLGNHIEKRNFLIDTLHQSVRR